MNLFSIEKTNNNDQNNQEKNGNSMNTVYDSVMKYKNQHPGGIAWRIKKHCEVVNIHLNPGEKVIYALAGQKNDSYTDIFSSCVLCLTNKRILIGQKRVLYGYYLTSITPDLFNDLEIYRGLIWGRVTIDTVKEVVIITNVAKSALSEIETNITEFMMQEKQKYGSRPIVK